jgi:hypothetical protein
LSRYSANISLQIQRVFIFPQISGLSQAPFFPCGMVTIVPIVSFGVIRGSIHEQPSIDVWNLNLLIPLQPGTTPLTTMKADCIG